MTGPFRGLGRLVCCLAWLAGTATFSADAPLRPLTVCEVLRDLSAQEGKSIAVLGRYSFRGNGRWVGEQACDPDAGVPPTLWLVENIDAPRPPDDFELDAVVLQRKWTEMQRHTTLAKFRFGSTDYDRWAVIFGKVEARKGEDAKKAAANLVYRGSGVILFLTTER